MKHCILIIAHNNFDQLKLLISMLDDERNDIYVHIDKKVKILPSLKLSKANIILLEERIDVRWGDISQIETELLLFETAFKNGPYKMYHLISGIDLPIKSNDYIHSYVEEHPGVEYMGFCDMTKSVYNRVERYNFFTRFYRTPNMMLRILFLCLRYIIECIFLFKRKKCPLELKFGPNWASITNEFCGYLLSKKDFILKYFKYSSCGDELYKQTILWNSPFRDNIYELKDANRSAKRLIDWDRGNPYIWGQEPDKDLSLIKKSECFFIRKIDLKKYPKFVEDMIKVIDT